MSNLVWDLGLGAAIRYGASRVMDLATGWFFEHQSQASRQREVEVAPGGTPVVVGKRLAELAVAPPPGAYPVESHLWGVVGHLTFGVATGAMLAIALQLGAMTGTSEMPGGRPR